MTNKIIRIMTLNIAILLIGVIVIELAWRALFANDIRYTVNVLADSHYKMDVSELYESEKKVISYNRDKNGLRGSYNSLEDIDIMVVGGSTTDQRYIDDNDEWSRVIQKHLQAAGKDVTVVNAGVDGQSTFGHIKNFDLWFSTLDGLQPKYVLFFIGVNDFYVDGTASYDALSSTNSLKGIIRSSFPYYLFRLGKGLILTKVNNIDHESQNWLSLSTTTSPLNKPESYQPLMSNRLEAYRERLRALVDRTKSIGATPIFVTQRKMSYWTENGQITGLAKVADYEGAQYNGVDMYYMNKLLSMKTMSICNEVSGAICIDLESELELEQKDFYDSAHNTPSGANKIGLFLADKIKQFY